MLNLSTEDVSVDHAAEQELKGLQPPPDSHENHHFNLKLYNRDSGLLVIHEAAKLIDRSPSSTFAINAMLRMMSQVLGLNRGRVLLPEDNQLCIRYSYGLTQHEHQRGVYLSGEGITGKVMATGQLVVIENIDEEPGLLFRAVNRTTLPQETVSYIALPIMDGNTPIGVLGCHRIRSRMRPIDDDLVVLRTFSTFISQALKIDRLQEQQNELFHATVSSQNSNQKQQNIIGESVAIKDVLDQVEQVGEVDATVLLTGESGSGKECFARLIHETNARKDKPFVAINCAAIPEHLLEAELFGYEKGAFTGAVSKKPGKFEVANGGTLFLDEIGDLNADLQTKLLRVLETQSVQRIGSIKEIPVDVRIIAATHKDLMDAVNKEMFRLDLFYRLHVFPLHLPALRERQNDVVLLANHFLNSAMQEYQRSAVFEKGVIERFKRYEWPGNIRQLENVIKRALLLSKNGKITTDNIDRILATESRIRIPRPQSAVSDSDYDKSPLIDHNRPYFPPTEKVSSAASLHSNFNSNSHSDKSRRHYSWVNDDESAEICAALKQARGNKTQAASLLGMTARQLRYRLSKLGIKG